ncbi:hypothetical protein ACLMJK_004163 [Lecanora helva]
MDWSDDQTAQATRLGHSQIDQSEVPYEISGREDVGGSVAEITKWGRVAPRGYDDKFYCPPPPSPRRIYLQAEETERLRLLREISVRRSLTAGAVEDLRWSRVTRRGHDSKFNCPPPPPTRSHATASAPQRSDWCDTDSIAATLVGSDLDITYHDCCSAQRKLG